MKRILLIAATFLCLANPAQASIGAILDEGIITTGDAAALRVGGLVDGLADQLRFCAGFRCLEILGSLDGLVQAVHLCLVLCRLRV